jgi:hypothetical protein
MGEAQTHSLLGVAQSWLPVLTVVGGALWGLYTFIDHQKESNRLLQEQAQRDGQARLIEAQRPFLQKQLDLYFETAQIAGRLVTIKPGTDKWQENETRFWALYWSELSMVEHGVVEAAMKHFGDTLLVYDGKPDDPATRRALESAAYELAHAIRSGIESAWGGNQTQGNRI